MKAGTIFNHPIQDSDGTVKLIAVENLDCKGCVFSDKEYCCYSNVIGARRMTGSCVGLIFKIHEPDEEAKKYKHKEVLVDIAYEAAAKGYGSEMNHRTLVVDIISWADEFMELHKDTNWEEVYYMEAIHNYMLDKIKT